MRFTDKCANCGELLDWQTAQEEEFLEDPSLCDDCYEAKEAGEELEINQGSGITWLDESWEAA